MKIKPSEIFPRRLKQARVLNGLSMEELAELTGYAVSRQVISRYETGRHMPKSDSLIALSEALNLDVDFFFRPFTLDPEEFECSFRKRLGTGIKDVNALKALIQDRVERYLEIEEMLGKSAESLGKTDGDAITTAAQMRRAAQEVRKDWHLADTPVACVRSLLEFRGARIVVVDSPESFDAISAVVNGDRSVIVLNGNRDTCTERTRLALMRELGRLLLGDRIPEKFTGHKKDELCNAFADEMLLPSDIIGKTFQPGVTISLAELEYLQTEFGIMIDDILYKLKDVGIIKPHRLSVFRKYMNSNEAVKARVETSRYTESMTDNFETMVYAALARELISTSKAACLLRTKVATVRSNLIII